MAIYLGDLTVSQIERRFEFEFTEDERERLRELHHAHAEFKDGDSGWHMFDIPEFLCLSDGPIGREVLDIFMRHNSEIHGAFGAGYGCVEGGDAE